MVETLGPKQPWPQLPSCLLALDAAPLQRLLEELLAAAGGLEARLEEEASARRFVSTSLTEQQRQLEDVQRSFQERLGSLEALVGDGRARAQQQEAESGSAAASLERLEQRVADAEQTLQALGEGLEGAAGARKELQQELLTGAVAHSRQAAARVEQQLKAQKEEGWARMEEVDRRSEARNQKLHAELVRKAGRTELEQATEDLQQQLADLQRKFSAQIERSEHQQLRSLQRLEANLPQLRAQVLDALAGVHSGASSSACTTTCISCFRPRSTSPPGGRDARTARSIDLSFSASEQQGTAAGSSRPPSARGTRGGAPARLGVAATCSGAEQSAAAVAAVSPAVAGLPSGPSIPTLPRSPNEELPEEGLGPFEVHLQRDRSQRRHSAETSTLGPAMAGAAGAAARPKSACRRRPDSARTAREAMGSLAHTAARAQASREIVL